MNDQELAGIVIGHIRKLLDTDLSPGYEDDLTEFGLHSIASISLLVELENQFDIVYEDEELLLENFATVGMIVEGLKRKRNEREEEPCGRDG